MIEIQALTVPAKSGFSRVYSDRVDPGKVSKIAAVLRNRYPSNFPIRISM